jgi:hypothetical protein
LENSIMKFEVSPIGHVAASCTEATDDYWGGSRSSIVSSAARVTSRALVFPDANIGSSS